MCSELLDFCLEVLLPVFVFLWKMKDCGTARRLLSLTDERYGRVHPRKAGCQCVLFFASLMVSNAPNKRMFSTCFSSHLCSLFKMDFRELELAEIKLH